MIDGAHDAAQEHQGEDLDTLKTVLGYAQIPYFDELSDLGDIWQKIQKGELPEAYTEAQANQGTGTLAFQTSILNAMIANTPEIAQDPRVSPYIVGNRIEIPPELKSNAGNDFTKWFIEVAKPIYGIDQSDWESQRNRGNNDDW